MNFRDTHEAPRFHVVRSLLDRERNTGWNTQVKAIVEEFALSMA
jgi:hypothetical protein